REPMPARRIAGPHSRHQAVADLVRDADRVLLVLERDHRHDRAEDLLLRDAHRVVDLREHGGPVEGALPVADVAAGHDLGALGAACSTNPCTLSRCALEISEPTCVSGSSGSPTRSCSVFAANSLTKSS